MTATPTAFPTSATSRRANPWTADGNGVPDECEAVCRWDCGDGSGFVDTVDFLALLSEWGQVGTPCDGDDNGVDTVDFLALLANWGPCS